MFFVLLYFLKMWKRSRNVWNRRSYPKHVSLLSFSKIGWKFVELEAFKVEFLGFWILMIFGQFFCKVAKKWEKSIYLGKYKPENLENSFVDRYYHEIEHPEESSEKKSKFRFLESLKFSKIATKIDIETPFLTKILHFSSKFKNLKWL